MGAGTSAEQEARRSRLLAEAHRRAAADALATAARYDVAARTERSTARVLAPLSACGYAQLADRRWPGSRRANVDLLLVGPGGVFVVDVKCWADVSVEGRHLYRGQECADDDVATLLRLTALVDAAVTEVGLAPLEVVPVLAFAGRQGVRHQLGRVQLLGERDLAAFCLRRGTRLTEAQVESVLGALGAAFPPYDAPQTPPEVSAVVPAPVLPTADRPVQAVLIDDEELRRAVVEGALAAPIEDWMVFLHPDQARTVRRGYAGPARIRGAAGTGKTVLGLHRVAYLAATRPGRILYVSYVRTLPVVLGELYRRMAPTTYDRVEFTGLHRWTLQLLADRGVPVNVDARAADRAYARAWAEAGQHSALGRLGVPWTYWQEEIDHVVKGRGLTDFAEYADLVRVGRRTRLTLEHRQAVWELYERYERQLRALGVHDFNDVLLLALRSVRDRPVSPPYVAVVADEVQDLNRVGVQLLHALVGDAPDGLLLIGDGQQCVYPGGFTLAEAGIAVTGRSTVLRVNYRNTQEILAAATAVVAQDRFDDLEGLEEVGVRDCEVVRCGPEPVRVTARDITCHDAALLTELAEATCRLGVRRGDLAVLAARRATVAHYRTVLTRAGVPWVDLEEYDGRTVDRVKLGTFKRAKGLEFAHVFLPLLTDGASPRRPEEPEPAYRERVERERRELFVAMTRARDRLWLGYVRPRREQ